MDLGRQYPRTYNSWNGAMNRCNNPNHPKYHLYGGRGITICNQWRVFSSFLRDMGQKPRNLTLDRIDNDGNYEPGNCRWATQKQQQRNRRGIVPLTINGTTKLLTDWANEMEIDRRTISKRLKRGWSDEDAVLTPSRYPKGFRHDV